MRGRRLFLVGLAIVFHLVTGCTGVQLEDHSYKFNKATGSLGLRLLLLNAVRASKDYPLQFSKIGTYHGRGAMGGSISASLPLQSFPGNGTVIPKVDWNDGISQIALVDLNTEEAQQALKRPLGPDAYEYFFSYRGTRSIAVLNAVLIESFKISETLYERIDFSSAKYCKKYMNGKVPDHLSRYMGEDQKSRMKEACKAIVAIQRNPSCSNESPHVQTQILELEDNRKKGKKILSVPESFFFFRTRPTNDCHSMRFAAFGLMLYVLDFHVTPRQSEQDDSGQEIRQKPGEVQKAGANTIQIYAAESKGDGRQRKTGYAYSFSDPDVMADNMCESDKIWIKSHKIRIMCKKAHRKGTFPDGFPIDIRFRSPERMVRFIGELIAAQHFKQPYEARITFDPESKSFVTLFSVNRGKPPPGGAAVAVDGPEGEIFYIAPSGAQKNDRSLEVLSIVADALNGAVSKKDLPPQTTLTLVPQ